jgi:hypothetical protein
MSRLHRRPAIARPAIARPAIVAIGATLLVAALVVAARPVPLGAPTVAADGGTGDAAVVGRFSVDSPAGGAVWTFQEDGDLVVLGPGDLVARGSWTHGGLPGELDATLGLPITGQTLSVLGAVSPDGRQVALYVAASEAASPLDGSPWPAVSRLVGDRIGLIAEPTASPTAPAADCLRPAWLPDAAVDWDRCGDQAGAPVASPSSAASLSA